MTFKGGAPVKAAGTEWACALAKVEVPAVHGAQLGAVAVDDTSLLLHISRPYRARGHKVLRQRKARHAVRMCQRHGQNNSGERVALRGVN